MRLINALVDATAASIGSQTSGTCQAVAWDRAIIRVSWGQARIATVKERDRNDNIILQEKLDDTNVGVARLDGVLNPLVRAATLPTLHLSSSTGALPDGRMRIRIVFPPF
ncbi:MAG TPA: hypothetical protein VGN86_17150 [Pyrinomonadaceae bacterium]|nr:hypothetical protein [Pyrinomonadaceae bacterium]